VQRVETLVEARSVEAVPTGRGNPESGVSLGIHAVSLGPVHVLDAVALGRAPTAGSGKSKHDPIVRKSRF
jgi:hypothetical protein